MMSDWATKQHKNFSVGKHSHAHGKHNITKNSKGLYMSLTQPRITVDHPQQHQLSCGKGCGKG